MSTPEPPPPVHLLGVPIHPVTAAEVVELLVAWGHGDRLRRALYVNVHGMNLAAGDADLRAALRAADLVFCDGFGVKWGARLVGARIPARLTPPDWIDAFAGASTASGQSVYALGDEPGIAAMFQARLAADHPGYRAAGAHDGFDRDDAAVVARINASGATHLLVGMGMPTQEKWIARNAEALRVRTVLTVGALFRWHAGIETRAPRWMTDRGLEWLARFARDPVRHFRRYALGNPRFLFRLLGERLRRAA